MATRNFNQLYFNHSKKLFIYLLYQFQLKRTIKYIPYSGIYFTENHITTNQEPRGQAHEV